MFSLTGSALIAGIAVGLLAWAVLSMLFSEERAVSRRLRAMSATEYAQAGEIEPLTKSFNDRVVRQMGHSTTRWLGSLMPSEYAKRLAVRIRLSGPRRRLTPETFVLAKIVLGVLGFVLGMWVARSLASPFFGLAALVVATCAGFFGPDAWLSGRVQARQEAIRRALPDMLDMLMVSVEAGLGFDASLAKVVSSTKGPLSEEFAIVLQEIQSGIPRRDALQHLAARTDVPSISAFIMAIVQADTFGVSIANVLRQQSKEMRVRRRQRAEELAQKAPAKMVFPLILCILPATLIVIAGPAVIRIARAFGAPV